MQTERVTQPPTRSVDDAPAAGPDSAGSDSAGRPTVALIGGGMMGEALLTGILRGDHDSGEVVVVERHAQRAAQLAERHGVRIVEFDEALRFADIVVLAVKPQDVPAVLQQLNVGLRPAQLVVSIAAGLTTTNLEDALPAGTRVVRCMPNTPALVDRGMTAICAGSLADEDALAATEALFASVGEVERIPESQFDAVTALSGSGPAYFYYLVEALIDAGVLLGVPRATAARLVVQTALGSATMLRETGEHPVTLREAVSSPGGTTIAAARTLEEHGVRVGVMAAVESAARRSAALRGDK